MHACGAADIVAEMDWDDDDDEAIDNRPVYFSGPFVPDDTLPSAGRSTPGLAFMSQISSANLFIA